MTRRKKIALTVLGCPKNRADAENVAGILDRSGFKTVGEDAEADVAMLFTCAFVRDAENESVETIGNLERLKAEGRIKAIVVVGCLPDRHRGETGIDQTLSAVDAWVGAADYPNLPEIVTRALGGARSFDLPPQHGFLQSGADRKRLGDEPFAYVKIGEGCKNRCAYCTIPSIRGDFRSRKMVDIVDEAEKLVETGAKEIVLVGQDTAYYGVDIYGGKKLGALLSKTANRIPDSWIRVMYCHPAHLDEVAIEAIARHPNVCRYIDLPVQHAADSVLKRMKRPLTRRKMTALIKRIREILPDVVLRTTAMVGFPGETESEFRELLDFIREIRFERLGVFAYSREEGAPAFHLPGQISEKIKADRLDTVMRLQQEISLEIHQSWIGRVMQVLIDGKTGDKAGFVAARSTGFAPEIDGCIYIPDRGYKPGRLITVKITNALPYDLEGEPV